MNSGPDFPCDIDFLRIMWCDNANIIRAKALYQPPLNLNCSVGISEAQQAISTMGAVVNKTGLSPVGEIQLQVDLDSLTPIPYASSQARAMGDMMKDGAVWEYCPRGFLKKIIRKADKMGLEIKSAFENEFYILKKTENGLETSDNTPFAAAHAMDVNQEIIAAMVGALNEQGMEVQQYYPESGPGQQEITINYADALKSCDNQINYRETVKAIAADHGYLASFLPKIFPNKTGSGCHIHMSLWKDDRNIFSDPEGEYGISITGKQFIAGILHHLPSLMAITTPIPNSYRRIEPQTWSGAYQCWGMDNRESAIRVIKDFDGMVTNFELKTVDSASNPYLALGSIIAAGLNGIKKQIELPNPLQEDPAYIPPDEMKNRGIKKLPTDLKQSLALLKRDNTIINAMGDKLSKAYIAIKETDIKDLGDLTLEDEVDLLLNIY